jgi:hypothetical protein
MYSASLELQLQERKMDFLGCFLVSLSLALSSLRYAPYLLVSLGGILGDILGGILGGSLRSATATVGVEYYSCSAVVETLSCALPLEEVHSCLVLLLQLDGVFWFHLVVLLQLGIICWF